MRSIFTLFLVTSLAVACTSSSPSKDDDDDNDTGENDGSSSGSDPTGSSSGGTSSGGSSGRTSSSGGSGNAAVPLGPTELIFEKHVDERRDHLLVMDYASGETRVLATLEEGTVDGWSIDGARVSPDRTHVALASRYGSTAADVATGISANSISILPVTGGALRRITPTFPNSRPDNANWQIDVRDPVYSPDGTQVLFNYGEGDGTSGYVAPWSIAVAGGATPRLIDLAKGAACSVNSNMTFHPTTGAMLVEHSVCIGSEPSGYFLYPAAGGDPDHLVNDDGVSLSSETPAFSPDGSMFVYTAREQASGLRSLYAYLMAERRVVTLLPGTAERAIVNASFAPDNAHLVYCVQAGTAYDLRVIDLSTDPPVDRALTTDGVSCDPAF